MNAKFIEYYNSLKKVDGYSVFLLNNLLSYNESGKTTENDDFLKKDEVGRLLNQEIFEFGEAVRVLESQWATAIAIHPVERNGGRFCFFKVANTTQVVGRGKTWLFVCMWKQDEEGPPKYMVKEINFYCEVQACREYGSVSDCMERIVFSFFGLKG